MHMPAAESENIPAFSFSISSTLLGDLDMLLLLPSCSVKSEVVSSFGLESWTIDYINGRERMKCMGGVLTACPLLSGNKVLYSVGGIVVHALSLRNEEKIPLPSILMLSFTSKLETWGRSLNP